MSKIILKTYTDKEGFTYGVPYKGGVIVDAFFFIITGIITILCVMGLIKTVKAKNLIGAGMAFAAVAVFGFFTIAETLNLIGII